MLILRLCPSFRNVPASDIVPDNARPLPLYSHSHTHSHHTSYDQHASTTYTRLNSNTRLSQHFASHSHSHAENAPVDARRADTNQSSSRDYHGQGSKRVIPSTEDIPVTGWIKKRRENGQREREKRIDESRQVRGSEGVREKDKGGVSVGEGGWVKQRTREEREERRVEEQQKQTEKKKEKQKHDDCWEEWSQGGEEEWADKKGELKDKEGGGKRARSAKVWHSSEADSFVPANMPDLRCPDQYIDKREFGECLSYGSESAAVCMSKLNSS